MVDLKSGWSGKRKEGVNTCNWITVVFLECAFKILKYKTPSIRSGISFGAGANCGLGCQSQYLDEGILHWPLNFKIPGATTLASYNPFTLSVHDWHFLASYLGSYCIYVQSSILIFWDNYRAYRRCYGLVDSRLACQAQVCSSNTLVVVAIKLKTIPTVSPCVSTQCSSITLTLTLTPNVCCRCAPREFVLNYRRDYVVRAIKFTYRKNSREKKFI